MYIFLLRSKKKPGSGLKHEFWSDGPLVDKCCLISHVMDVMGSLQVPWIPQLKLPTSNANAKQKPEQPDVANERFD